MSRSVSQNGSNVRNNLYSSKASSFSSLSKDDSSAFDRSYSLSPMQSGSEFMHTNSTITYLFPDFRALKLILDKEKVYEEVEVAGFEIYIVEQWACERKYSTIITSYTGDSDHVIKVGKLVLPTNLSKWSPETLSFFKEIEESGAKPKLTDHGHLFITNLSQFPSNLNLLPITCGCVLDVWDNFVVNLNLRKMKCSGRSAILLCEPSDAAEDKFRQIYKIHPKAEITYAVKELVRLVQICLVDFKLLNPLFADGLFCTSTEARISDWWNLYGTMYFGYTPKDGILSPMTVSALLGFVLSCTFRLDMAGSDFPKEPFNYFNFRVNVGRFQKQHNLPKTWYLDPATVEKLFRVTSKSASSDLSKLKKVVQDIAGKMRNEHAAVEVLTTDLEKAIKYFGCSARLEYLWYGKGNVNYLKSFDYSPERLANSSSQNIVSSSALRSGVGKIKKFPKMLQPDEYYLRRKWNKVNQEAAGECPLESFDENCIADVRNSPICCESAPEVCRDLYQNTSDVKRCLQRRTSFPYVRKEVQISQLDYENHALSLVAPIEENLTLKRVKSTSFISDTTEHWTKQISGERLANLFIDTKFKLIQFDKQSRTDLDTLKNFKKSLNTLRPKVYAMKHQITPLFNNCEYENHQQERALGKIKDIQATGARLEYEMRLLSKKVRDTEESVDGFARKVEDLEKMIDERFLEYKKKSLTYQGNDDWYIRIANNQNLWKYMDRLQEYSIFKWISYQFGLDIISDEPKNKQDVKDYKKKTLMKNETTINNEKLKRT